MQRRHNNGADLKARHYILRALTGISVLWNIAIGIGSSYMLLFAQTAINTIFALLSYRKSKSYLQKNAGGISMMFTVLSDCYITYSSTKIAYHSLSLMTWDAIAKCVGLNSPFSYSISVGYLALGVDILLLTLRAIMYTEAYLGMREWTQDASRSPPPYQQKK